MPVVFKKGYNGSIPPKLKQERKEQQRKQNQQHQQHQQHQQQQYQPNPSIQDLALATPLTKVFLDVNKRQEMGLLPRLHRGNLYKMFQQYAKRDGVGLNSQELFQWMVDGKKEQKNDQKEEQQEGAWMAPIDAAAAGGGGSGGGGGGMTCVVAVQGGTSIGSDGTQGKERIVGSDGHRVAFISSTVCCLGLFPHAARIGVRFLRQHCSNCSKLFRT